jgi:trigger factor
MKVSVEELSSVERRLSVDIDAKDVDKAFSKVYNQLKKQAKIKGFRPGKIPRPVLERYYGPQAAAQVAEDLVSGTYTDALAQGKVEPVAQPKFDFVAPEAGKDYSYELTLDVKPEFDLAAEAYQGLELKEPDLKVDDEQVSQRLEAMRERQAVLVPLEEERPAATGDVVVINYDSFLDGEALEGGSAENAEVELGKGTAQEEIEVALVKSKPGDMLEATVSYDENASDPKVRGKDVVFKLFVKEIKEKKLPELDDDFARSVSPEFDGLDQLKERIQSEMEKAFDGQKESAVRNQILDSLRGLVEFEIPQSLVEEEVKSQVENFKSRLRQSGLDPDQAGLDDEKIKEDFREGAEKTVKAGIILGKIADLENVEVSEDDMDAEFEKMSEATGQPAQALKQIYTHNNMMASFNAHVMEQKTLQAIKASAKIKVVDAAELAEDTE